MGTSALSVSDGGSLQDLWYLYLRVGMGFADDQLPFRGTHDASDFYDCAANIRRARRDLVCAGMGIQSLHLVLVDSLDLGHYFHSAYFESDLSGGIGTAGVARLPGLDYLCGTLGGGGAGQSDDASIPSILWSLDMAAAIQEWSALVGRRRVRLSDFLSYPFTMGRPKLRSVRSIRFSARRFWASVSPGQQQDG